MALAVNRRLAGNAAVRAAFFIPSLLPMIAIANLWLFFYTPQLGLLNKLLALFSVAPVNWLGEPGTTLGCLMAVSVWREAGFFMIFIWLRYSRSIRASAKQHKSKGRQRGIFFAASSGRY